MLVSIVITNYNKGKYLPFLFKILELTLQPEIEIIVIDDGSTQQFDLDFLKESQFQIYYNKINKGIGYVRNYALTLCKGKYIAFCIFLNNKLDKILNSFLSFKNAINF